MTAATFVVAALGGGIGAALRFVIDGVVMRRAQTGYPWGTFVINATGSLVLGLLTGLADSSLLHSSWLFILGSGVIGGYTTFSTVMVDTVSMLQKRTYGRALWNAFGMLVLTGILALSGLLLGRAL